jgi:hypothetical protein
MGLFAVCHSSPDRAGCMAPARGVQRRPTGGRRRTPACANQRREKKARQERADEAARESQAREEARTAELRPAVLTIESDPPATLGEAQFYQELEYYCGACHLPPITAGGEQNFGLWFGTRAGPTSNAEHRQCNGTRFDGSPGPATRWGPCSFAARSSSADGSGWIDPDRGVRRRRL